MKVKSVCSIATFFIICVLNSLAAHGLEGDGYAGSDFKEQPVSKGQLTQDELMFIAEKRLEEMPEELKPFILNIGKTEFHDEEHLYRVHNDAYYAPYAISGSGDVIQLHDGSKWSVHPYQRKTVLYWVQSDLIFIKPKSSCFSMYSYVLQNRTTKEVVEVNLIGSPLSSTATRWVVNIDPYQRLIQLNDNTIWQVDSNDYAFSKWHIGHQIIIGVNNHWRIAKFPHILINTNLYQTPYSEAEFIGFPAGY